MSKYIRTKDGKILVSDEYGYAVRTSLGYVTCLGSVMIKVKDICREADDLKDLIDGYYVEIEGYGFDIHHTFDNLDEAKEDYKDWSYYYHVRHEIDYEITLYGFIKTDKGFDYVVKMNDETGELERL